VADWQYQISKKFGGWDMGHGTRTWHIIQVVNREGVCPPANYTGSGRAPIKIELDAF